MERIEYGTVEYRTVNHTGFEDMTKFHLQTIVHCFEKLYDWKPLGVICAMGEVFPEGVNLVVWINLRVSID